MDVEVGKMNKNSLQQWWKTHIVLRLVTLITSFTSAIIIFKNNETTDTFGFPMSIKYSDDTNFKFFAYANMIVACFSAIALILFVVVASRKSIKPIVVFFFFLHDLIMLMLVTAACAVATSIGYEGKHGNTKAGWMAICPYVPNYCRKGTMAGAISYICLVNYFLLSVMYAKQI
ncbi:CASP-like protein 1F2 [Impatiens glandulifera]|uniref:CASP-like protein 1F2 n=1 Tax=Impatiens glandulifera TaxID=253017 RepID=UPI001FB0F4B7|nr:CASP-like protein 1F2 [Impatiens glandulifera]